MRLDSIVTSTFPHLVFHYWIPARQWHASFRFWRSGENIQESLRPEVTSENEHFVGALEHRWRDHHLLRIDCVESVQQLRYDCAFDRFLVDDADVWNRHQEVLERSIAACEIISLQRAFYPRAKLGLQSVLKVSIRKARKSDSTRFIDL